MPTEMANVVSCTWLAPTRVSRQDRGCPDAQTAAPTKTWNSHDLFREPVTLPLPVAPEAATSASTDSVARVAAIGHNQPRDDARTTPC